MLNWHVYNKLLLTYLLTKWYVTYFLCQSIKFRAISQGCGLGLNASVSRPPRGVPTPRLGLASVSGFDASVSVSGLNASCNIPWLVHSSYVIQNKSYWRIRISPIVDRLTKNELINKN